MMDDLLSQEEIEALLSGANNNNDNTAANNENNNVDIDQILSKEEQDTLGEIGNITFSSSATALSKLLNQKVEITTPSISYIKREVLLNEFEEPFVAIQVSYTEALEGANLLIMEVEDASIIADLMMGGDGSNKKSELNEIELSAVQEAMNQMMGSAATSLSTMINAKVDITPPVVKVLDFDSNDNTELVPVVDSFIRVSFQLSVGDLIDSYIMQLITPDFANTLLSQLPELKVQEDLPKAQSEEPSPEPAPVVPPMPEPAPVQQQMPQQQPMYQQPMYQQPMYQQPMYQQPPVQPQAPPVNVQPATFATFQPEPLGQAETRNLNMLMDISLNVTVELGRTRKTIKEILEFGHGSIIELDRLAGEPIDILINNRPIAKAEVVVIEENFGVRIIEILSPSDRINQLK